MEGASCDCSISVHTGFRDIYTLLRTFGSLAGGGGGVSVDQMGKD